MIGSTAKADAIPSYTVTDLGPNQNYTLSNTRADGTLTTASGAVYAFPRTDNLVANPQSLLNTFPPFTNAPIHDSSTYGNPNFAYSYFDSSIGVFLNKAGEFVATDIFGVDAHAASSGSIVYTSTRQTDGSFGQLTALWSTHDNHYSGGQIAMALDLNNAGQALGIDAGGKGWNYYFGERDAFMYDLHSGVRTELATLLPSGWYWPIPYAIDDQGRILLASESDTPPYSKPEELFLLTPLGLSSAPIATPEPSTLATLAVAGLALVIRRKWKS